MLLALLSRESAAIWLLLFLLHVFFVETKLSRSARVIAFAGCVFLLAGYVGFRLLPVQRAMPSASGGWPAPMRAALVARSMGDYIRLLVFPTNLHMERSVLEPRSYANKAAWRSAPGAEYLSILGAAGFAVIGFACWRRGPGRAARLFGAGWFLVAYLPISNLISLNATVAEHWMYLPSVGFLIFLAGCLVELPVRHRRTVVSFACIAAAALAARSVVRSTDWADEETFYTRTIAAGGSSTRAATNLAEIYSRKGDHAGAERIFRRVLELTPDYPMARNNLANLLQKQGRSEEAQSMFGSSAKAAEVDRNEYPGTWVAAVNLAHLRHSEGDIPKAMEILDRARRDYPETWEVIRFQAELLRVSKRNDDAIKTVATFAEKNWWHYGASIALGRLHAEQGNVDAAYAAWRHASWLDVHDAESLNLIAGVRVRQNRLEEAMETQRRAVARQPDEPRQYRILSDILMQMGRSDEAREALAYFAQLEASVGSAARAN
jgi:Flp pilus assembly protein TadD